MLSFGEMHRFEPKLIFGYRNSVFCEKAVCPWLDRLHFFGPQTVVLQIFNICKTRLASIGSKLGFNLVKN